MSSEKVQAAIKVECERQRVGEDRQRFLERAYSYARLIQFKGRDLDDGHVADLAYMIEPDNRGQYRHLPVSFHGIVGGVNPEHIWWVMQHWVEWFNTNKKLAAMDATDKEHFVDPVIKEFLDIHPFSDGNGRLAWLFRVWMLNQWDDPEPLPDYYGYKQR